jgi:hypothetical protein
MGLTIRGWNGQFQELEFPKISEQTTPKIRGRLIFACFDRKLREC